MIENNTVFVLGAGAHVPYNFPDGPGLVSKIIAALPTTPGDATDFYKRVHAIHNNGDNTDAGDMATFREALNIGGHASIDTFLATHGKRPGFATIGKLAIAYILAPLEFRQTWDNSGVPGDWLSYLFTSMLRGCLYSVDKLKMNKVSFVTFNYDRTLEHFLCKRIAYTYNMDYQTAWGHASAFPIIHVYGSLGEFTPAVLDARKPPERLELAMRNGANSIRLMYDARNDQPELARAMELLRGAAKICVLGFSFDPDNVARLKLTECCARADNRVLATRYKLGFGEWQRARQLMHPVQMGFNNAVQETAHRDWDCLQLFRETNAVD